MNDAARADRRRDRQDQATIDEPGMATGTGARLWLRTHWSAIIGLGLIPVGAVVTVLGMGLVFNFFSLRYWVARRIPFLAEAIARARGPLNHDEAQLLEGLVAGLGVGLVAVAMSIALLSLSRLRLRTHGARLIKRLGTWLMGLTIVGLLGLAVALPFLAMRLPPSLWTTAGVIKQIVGWALRLLPGF